MGNELKVVCRELEKYPGGRVWVVGSGGEREKVRDRLREE